MVRMTDLPDYEREYLLEIPCPTFDGDPWVAGPPVAERRVAIISTAGLQRREDRPFVRDDADYRVFHKDTDPADIVMSHVSVNFDRTGFQQDLNVVFPVERLKELEAEGAIGSVADYHYSFMGSTEPEDMEPLVREIAGYLKEDRVDAVLLAPV